MESQSIQEAKLEVKELIKRLGGYETPEELETIKTRFKDIVSKASPLVIAMAENDLVREGYKIEDLFSACEVHLLLFKDQIANPLIKVPEDHPIAHFQKEHAGILKIMELLAAEIKKLRGKASFEEAEKEIQNLTKIMDKLMESENHNVRQENTLFPILEKHHIEQPPAIMWQDHADMKEQKKAFIQILKNRQEEFSSWSNRLYTIAVHLTEKFALHSQKEQHILYMTALEVITEDEWKDIKEECDNLGYFDMQITGLIS